MNQEEDQGVKFFLTYQEKIRTLSSKGQDHLSVYMISRLVPFILDSKDVKSEDILQSERLILQQFDNPTNKRAELVSNYARRNAYAVEDDGRCRWIHIGYWSSICDWFMLSKIRDVKFLDLIYTAFIDGIDNYFADDDQAKIDNENDNFLKAYTSVQSDNLNDTLAFIEWAKSVEPGKKLLDFGEGKLGKRTE